MPRTTAAVPRHSRKKRLLKSARGNYGARSKRFRSAKETMLRAGNYAWAARRQRKGDFRSLWITRLSAACMSYGINYSRFIYGMNKAGIALNRKILSEMAINDPQAFELIVTSSKQQLAQA